MATYVLIGATVLVTWYAFTNVRFFESFAFHVEPILRRKEYYRAVSSAFLHVSLVHLLFNMFCFHSFGSNIERFFGAGILLGIYFCSMIGGDALALLIHRNHPDYRAVGASGAVSGVIFASIFLLPGGSVMMLFLPIPIPAPVFAILYTLISIYGIRSKRDNIGHEAHLGGAITGMLFVAVAYPGAVKESRLLFAAIMFAVVAFLIFPLRHSFGRLRAPFSAVPPAGASSQASSRDENEKDKAELNRLLDKITRVGMNGLTPREKKRLQSLAEKFREK